MNISYDEKAQAAYLSLRDEGTVARTVEIAGGVNIDKDSEGAVIGVELLYPARALPLEALKGEMSAEELKLTKNLSNSLRNVLQKVAVAKRGR